MFLRSSGWMCAFQASPYPALALEPVNAIRCSLKYVTRPWESHIQTRVGDCICHNPKAFLVVSKMDDPEPCNPTKGAPTIRPDSMDKGRLVSGSGPRSQPRVVEGLAPC